MKIFLNIMVTAVCFAGVDIFHEPDGYVIVDYKTDRFNDLSQLMGYKTQLALYKASFEMILGEKIKSCYIYSFWLRKGVEIKL